MNDTKLVTIKTLVEMLDKNTPELNCTLIAVVDKEGRHIESPDSIEAVIQFENK